MLLVRRISTNQRNRRIAQEMKNKSLKPESKPVKEVKRKNWRKQFTGIATADAEVAEPRYLEADSPLKSKGLDVALVGRPNAGKSSLMNAILGNSVSAVSPKYNTTRENVIGVYTKDNTQIAFHDTPGLVNEGERHKYIRTLVMSATESVSSVDLTLLLVDAVKRMDDDGYNAIHGIVEKSIMLQVPVLLVLNKLDLARNQQAVLPLVGKLENMIHTAWSNRKVQEETTGMARVPSKQGMVNCKPFMISATERRHVPQLLKALQNLALPREWMYHSSVQSELSTIHQVSEIIRGRLYQRYNQEIPYQIRQENRGWTTMKDTSIRIDQDIFVPSEHAKRIVIGKKGDGIRAIGISSRKDIQRLLGKPIHLYLNVRVSTSKHII